MNAQVLPLDPEVLAVENKFHKVMSEIEEEEELYSRHEVNSYEEYEVPDGFEDYELMSD